MTYYSDGNPCDYFDSESSEGVDGCTPSDCLVAIGWLHERAAYSQGLVTRVVRERLDELKSDAWGPVRLGYHYCPFCIAEVGRTVQDLRESGRYAPGEEPRGSRNLFVPGNGVVYVAPELITHYIDVHHYKPPEDFSAALLACPPMRSAEYFAALRAAGSAEFNRGLPPLESPAAPRRRWRFWSHEDTA